MNKSVFVALTATVALCGCHQSPANQGTTATAANDSLGTPVRLVGCLVPPAQSGAVGTSGNGSEPGFTLVDVTTTEASGAPGTNASVATGTPRSYSLIGDKNQDDLQTYQNSKVEVTGRIVASTDTGAGVPDVGAASTPAGTPPTAVQRVRVDTVRQLDKTCNSQTPTR